MVAGNEDIIISKLQYIVLSFASCFILITFLIMCLGNKKERRSLIEIQDISTKTVDIKEEININIIVPEIHDGVSSLPSSNFQIESVEASNSKNDGLPQAASSLRENSSDYPTTNYQRYDSQQNKSNSLPQGKSENPYESVQKHKKVSEVIAEDSGNSVKDSTSSSGNSENSGNYTRVKSVPKKEENAYLVVSIEEPSQNYDVVDGGLVRTPPSPNEKEISSETITKISESSITTASSLYAIVDKQRVIKEEEQENSGSSGYYASVTEEKKKTEEIDQEDYYDNCGPLTLLQENSSNPVPTLFSNKQDTYEVIGNTVQKSDSNYNDTYEAIDTINSAQQSTNNASKDDKGSRKSGKNHEKKEKKEKLKNAKQQLKLEKREKEKTNEDSPKHSRFSRKSIFKHSKKHRNSEGDINIEAKDKVSVDNKLNQSTSILLQAGKSSSLPKELIRRNTTNMLPTTPIDVPPPLPSVDKLKHITEHKKAGRTSSLQDGFSSADSSPRSSPRSADEKFCYVKKDSNISKSSIEGSVVLESTFEDDTDESYSKVDPDLKSQIIEQRHKRESIVLTEKSSRPSRTYTSNTANSDSDPKSPVKVLARISVGNFNELIRSSSQNSCVSEPDYADVSSKSGSMNVNIEIDQHSSNINENVFEEDPSYASVDLNKKERERQAVEFYAVVDKETLKLNANSDDTADNIEIRAVTPTYEGRYSVIPESQMAMNQPHNQPSTITDDNETHDYELLTTVSLPQSNNIPMSL